MARAIDTTEFSELLDRLLQPHALVELAVLAGCLLLAWALVALLRRGIHRERSVWFGERTVDGVLFPVVALALAYGARGLLAGSGKAAVFQLAVPILLSLALIRTCVRVLTLTFPESPWVRATERSISWLAWGAVVLWITGVLPVVLDAMDELSWKVGSTRISLRNAVEGAISAGLVLVISLWISAAIEKRLLLGSAYDLSLRKIAANLVRALLLFVGMLVALSAVGIDLTALSVLGGALGVGLGFGLQKIAANYISGFVILAERSLRIGDNVKVDNFEGRITDIRTRYTMLRALNGREAIVPNEMLITARVENSTAADPNQELTTTLQVAHGTPLDTLLPKLEAVMAGVPRVLADPKPVAHLSAFTPDGMELTLRYTIADPLAGTASVRSAVNLRVLDVLLAEKIEIPYPQRVLHRRPPPAGAERP